MRFDRNQYFRWLCDIVFCPDDYAPLLHELYMIPFYWSLPLDSNRASDGLKLRHEYIQDYDIYTEQEDDNPCSVLEVLVGLCIRCETDIMGEPGNDHPERWFWEMVHNLGLSGITSRNFDYQRIDNVVDGWVSRHFRRDGYGSPFPLKRAFRDQRKIQMWDQLQDYLTENYSS